MRSPGREKIQTFYLREITDGAAQEDDERAVRPVRQIAETRGVVADHGVHLEPVVFRMQRFTAGHQYLVANIERRIDRIEGSIVTGVQ